MQRLSLATASWRVRDCADRKWIPAVVPGCVHSDLRRAELIPDPFWGRNELDLQWIEERDWEYQAEFTVPQGLVAEEVVELAADGLDTLATVTLNGRPVGRTENMFVAHRWNVKRLLRSGTNTLSIRFSSAAKYIRTHRLGHKVREFNDPVGRCQVLRKQQSQFGWDWGPRFVTAGIWLDLRLEAWSANRLEGLRVSQAHAANGTVTLSLSPELTRAEGSVVCHYRLKLGDILVGEGTGNLVRVDHPQLWWPNGHGKQPLYSLSVEVRRRDGTLLGTWMNRIGLRTIVLDRHADAGGETFQFVVNGRAIFAKGANWIPAHSFVAGLARDDYARDLRAAAGAHMNMLRVWGGGVYESEAFYDLCDELGLLVWQDFMFACSLYPADTAFLASVRTEAEQQVRRLRHRACLALWCGNNEIEQLNADLLAEPKLGRGYKALFERVLPRAVTTFDGTTAYWPSSAHRPDGENSRQSGERHGDTHFWDVWHSRNPVKDYEKWRFRFVSEFGMQSYSSPQTQATFCPPGNGNVFGPEMENHQKNRAGNQIILDYVSRRYRFPKSQVDLVYLSQLNQAFCMQTGVEHYRRLMPHCMGALYWQLNDCWPVASWSSIEFTGRWKALHFESRRFYAPVLASIHIPGDEEVTIGNYRRSTANSAHLYTVSELADPAKAMLRWDLFHVDGRRLLSGKKPITLRYGQGVRQKTLSLGKTLAKFGRDNVVLRVGLDIDGRCVSENSAFFAPPRFVSLPKARTSATVELVGPKTGRITFSSDAYQHRFAFELRGITSQPTDNYFDLFAGEPKIVEVALGSSQTVAQLRAALSHHSLVDTY